MFILRRIGKVGNVIEEMYVCFFFFFYCNSTFSPSFQQFMRILYG